MLCAATLVALALSPIPGSAMTGRDGFALDLVLVVDSFSTPVTLLGDLGDFSSHTFLGPAGGQVQLGASGLLPIRLMRTGAAGDDYFRRWFMDVANGSTAFKRTGELRLVRSGDGTVLMKLQLQALWVSEYGIWSGPTGHGPPAIVERLTLVTDSITWPANP